MTYACVLHVVKTLNSLPFMSIPGNQKLYYQNFCNQKLQPKTFEPKAKQQTNPFSLLPT